MPDRKITPTTAQGAAMQRRRLLLRTGAVLALAPLAGAARAGFNFFLNEYTATRGELQAELGKRFPITRRYAELFSVSLHDPQLALDGQASRATLATRLVIASALLQPSSVGGQMAVSSALRWDAEGLALRLQDPRAEQLQIDGVTGRDAQNLQRVAAAVAQEALQGYPLHTFKPEELRVGRKTYEVEAIRIGSDEIKVQLK